MPQVAEMVAKEIKVVEATETMAGLKDALVTVAGALLITQIALHQATIAT